MGDNNVVVVLALIEAVQVIMLALIYLVNRAKDDANDG